MLREIFNDVYDNWIPDIHMNYSHIFFIIWNCTGWKVYNSSWKMYICVVLMLWNAYIIQFWMYLYPCMFTSCGSANLQAYCSGNILSYSLLWCTIWPLPPKYTFYCIKVLLYVSYYFVRKCSHINWYFLLVFLWWNVTSRKRIELRLILNLQGETILSICFSKMITPWESFVMFLFKS